MSEPNTSSPLGEATIHQDGELTLSVSRKIAPEAVDLLKRTIYGTRGVRYQHTNQEAKIQDLTRPLFFHLRKAGQLIGTYCLDERSLELGSSLTTGFYGRYLAVNEAYSGNGYGRLLKQQAIAYVEQNTPSPFLFYSYIEGKNERSIAISQKEGFESVATLKTYFFRRYSPFKDKRFIQATSADLLQMQPLLNQFYGSYGFKTFAHIGYKDQYFVLKEQGQIVAGVQANPVCWQFHQMAGWRGWILMNLVPLFSASRRFFNPARNEFLVLEGMYFQKGRPELLPILLESVLAHHNLHSAMCEIDQRDPLLQQLVDPSMGLLSGLEKDVSTHVLIKAKGLSDSVLQIKTPVYVSCFDYA
ncbi:GNAT family N-acetyltransferase [Spirosoma sp. BT702]|uniref:GNAT family N-acetyltransferase n=1 Tax=Spirosoma profusum TaxID=2771354 RepID=A0A927AUB0_9BACT|nr:GNAT family N-acetyltransferase [Spirosoma profusum]MBD2703362.1 GNAT family N-acetyltransferase [Spirosoma profusum]